MIKLRPFRAWRPAADKAHLVASRSYVTYDDKQLREKLAGNAYSFLHIIHPDPADQPSADRIERFDRVRRKFKTFCDDEVLVRDEQPCIYVYEQRARGDVSRGIVVGVSITDYLEGRIKVHEQTLTVRQSLFSEYLRATGINAEPVLLSTPEGPAWEALLDPVTGTRPQFDFSTTDRVRHRMWVVDDRQLIDKLLETFAGIKELYIADGHHRMASSADLATTTDGDVDPSAWCLAFIVPRSNLFIHNFDRTVNTLNGLSEAEFLVQLAKVGELRAMPGAVAAPGTIGVRTAGGWQQLTLPPVNETLQPAEKLDAARLSALILSPILGIHDLRTDPHVGFVPGTHGVTELERMVDSGKAAVAFHLHPVGFAELKAVADSGGTMPPKSTYVEPKLRSGLTIYSLEDV